MTLVNEGVGGIAAMSAVLKGSYLPRKLLHSILSDYRCDKISSCALYILQFVQTKYPGDQFLEHTSFPVGFQAQEIAVSIPEHGTIVDSEWKIRPITKPVVSSKTPLSEEVEDKRGPSRTFSIIIIMSFKTLNQSCVYKTHP